MRKLHVQIRLFGEVFAPCGLELLQLWKGTLSRFDCQVLISYAFLLLRRG